MVYFLIILSVISSILLYICLRLYRKGSVKVKGGPFTNVLKTTKEEPDHIIDKEQLNEEFVDPYENKMREELTFSDFGFAPKTVVFCYTYEIAKQVLTIVDKYGHRHQWGKRALYFIDHWTPGMSGTNCFSFGSRRKGTAQIEYCYLDWYQRNGYKIVDGRLFIKKHLK